MADRAARSRRYRRRRARRQRAVVLALGLAVLAAGGAVGVAATTTNGPARRVVTVALASVTRTVESSGTVTSSLKMTPSFPTSGTVTSVDVQVGDSVRAGQVLARQDTATLQAAVDAANSTLADSKQQLEADRTGQTRTATGSSGRDGSSGVTTSSLTQRSLSDPTTAPTTDPTPTHSAAKPPPRQSGSKPATTLSALIRQIEAAQNAVIAAQRGLDAARTAVDAAQHTVDADVRRNTTLRDAQKSACATSSDPSPTGSPSSTGSPSATDSGSDAPDPDACAGAMADYEASADTLSADLTVLDGKIGTEDGSITALDGAITALDKLISQLQNAAAGTGTGTGSGGQRTAPTGSGRTAAPTGSANRTAQSPSVSTSTGEPASAARLAADQAAIDAAEAQLNLAEQNLSAAILKSPATGTVAAIGLTAGASSSGQTITIVGTGVPGVTTTVPLGQIDEVKAGQSVSVAVDGVPTAVHGTVESIGLLSSTSGSSASFPVTVRLAATTRHLYDGSGADVVITTGTAANVVTVPISAVRSGIAGRHTVTVLSGGATSTVPVTLGIAGTAVVQVKTGLKVGQQVVLAELSQALPTSSTSGNTGTFRFPGGFTGAGGGRNFGGGGR